MLAAHNVLAFETACPVLDGNKAGCETRLDGRGLKANQDVTFRAALTERQINVDRVSIRKGAAWKADTHWKVDCQRVYTLNGPESATRLRERVARSWSSDQPPFTNADSYSRCFRYLDCFNGGMVSGSSPVFIAKARKAERERCGSATSKAVYLSSQLDRKTDCFDGGVSAIDLNEWACAGQSECDLSPTFKAVCGTQTKQGGCLYEQPTYNQNQAMSTPDNLVGGAERLDHTNRFVGSMTAQ